MSPSLRALLNNAVNTAADYAVCKVSKDHSDLEDKKFACIQAKERLENALEALEKAAKEGPIDYDLTTGSMLMNSGKWD